MSRTIPTTATLYMPGLYLYESYISNGKRFLIKWELYAAEGKCFYDLQIPENYDEEGNLKPMEERVYYRYTLMPKDPEYVNKNIVVVDLLPEYEVVN